MEFLHTFWESNIVNSFVYKFFISRYILILKIVSIIQFAIKLKHKNVFDI